MKNLLTILMLLCIGTALGQPTLSIRTQQDVAYIQKKRDRIEKGDKLLLRELPVMTIDGNYYVSFLGKRSENTVLQNLPNGAVIYGKSTGKIVGVRIRLDALDLIPTLTGLTHLELAGKIKPTLDKVVYDTRVDSVHAGFNLPEGYTGKDVVIGVTDWGFDYSSPMFYDTRRPSAPSSRSTP